MYVHVCVVVSNSLQAHGLWPSRLLCPCNFPGKNTGVGCHFLLQGIFPTQKSNLHLLPVSCIAADSSCSATREALILTRGTMSYSRFLGLTHLFNGNFISFEQQPLIPSLSFPSNHPIGYFCMLDCFGPLMNADLCSVCPSVTDLFHMA